MTFWSSETKCQLLCKFRAEQDSDFQGFTEQMDAHLGLCSFYVVNLLTSCRFCAPSNIRSHCIICPNRPGVPSFRRSRLLFSAFCERWDSIHFSSRASAGCPILRAFGFCEGWDFIILPASPAVPASTPPVLGLSSPSRSEISAVPPLKRRA
jgi:hypothetical protein